LSLPNPSRVDVDALGASPAERGNDGEEHSEANLPLHTVVLALQLGTISLKSPGDRDYGASW